VLDPTEIAEADVTPYPDEDLPGMPEASAADDSAAADTYTEDSDADAAGS
jgi:hypothetical protein